jgi:hypothetical protein
LATRARRSNRERAGMVGRSGFIDGVWRKSPPAATTP